MISTMGRIGDRISFTLIRVRARTRVYRVNAGRSPILPKDDIPVMWEGRVLMADREKADLVGKDDVLHRRVQDVREGLINGEVHPAAREALRESLDKADRTKPAREPGSPHGASEALGRALGKSWRPL
jgi:hypothetical protein